MSGDALYEAALMGCYAYPYVDGIEVARDEQDPLQICDLKVEGAVEPSQPYGTYQ